MTPAPQLLQLLESFKGRHTGVAFHPEDPHRDAIEAAAAQVGLVAVPDPKVEYRAIRGCTAPVATTAPAAAAPRVVGEPPPGVLLRSQWGDVIWQRGTDGDWYGTAPNGTHPSASWPELSSGKFGPLEMLVPVPLSAGMGTDEEVLGAALDQLMGPVLDAMEHLGAAAVSGFRVLLGDALRRGERRAAAEWSDTFALNHYLQGQTSPGVQELLREIQREQGQGRGPDGG